MTGALYFSFRLDRLAHVYEVELDFKFDATHQNGSKKTAVL